MQTLELKSTVTATKSPLDRLHSVLEMTGENTGTLKTDQ